MIFHPFPKKSTKKMHLKLGLVLFFSVINVFQTQNLDTIINEKVHLIMDEDQESTNFSNEEESDRKSSYPYQQQQQQSQQLQQLQQEQQEQNTDLLEIQQTSDLQPSKSIHHSNYPNRPVYSNSNSIVKSNHLLSKPRPTITHSHDSFTESNNQQQQVSQQISQQQQQQQISQHQQNPQQQQFDDAFTTYQSTQSSFLNLAESQHTGIENWPFTSSSQNSITIKPNNGEYTVNSNTLNFTNQGLENLKIYNITSSNHILQPMNTFTNIIPAINYNQQDPLSPMQIIANPIQNLVLRSFENFRRLIKNCNSIDNFLVSKMNLPKWSKIHTLDPLELSENLYFENRDHKTPLLGKLKFTLENVKVIGLSTFKTENLSNQGRTMYFKHRIPQLDFHANYTVDYHLFDEIPLLISKGYLKAFIPNAYIKGSFSVLPDILNVWFKINGLNLSSSVEDVDVKVYPLFTISDRFRVERSTLNKLSSAIKSIMPTIVDYLKVTYSKAIEMKIV